MDAVGVFKEIEKLAEPEQAKPELDPGEQAALAYNSMAKGLALAVPFANLPLVYKGLGGAVPWTGAPIRGVSKISDIPGPSEENKAYFTKKDTHPLMGLFDLEAKPKVQGVVSQDMHELATMADTVDSFIDKYDLKKKGVTMDFRYSPWGAVRGAHYDQVSKVVTMPRTSKEILLHELGHAADFTARAGASRALRGVVPALLLDGLIPAAYFVGDEIKKAVPGSIDDKVIDFTQKHGPALAMLALATKTLYPEGKASYLAIKHIHDVEGAAAARKAAAKLLPLFGTYALATLPVLAGFSLAKKYFYEAKKDEKTAGPGDFARGAGKSIVDIGSKFTDVGAQMWRGLGELTRRPDPVQALFAAGKTVVESPQFQTGAVYSALPAAVAAYASYAHPGGKAQRDKVMARQERLAKAGKISPDALAKRQREREFDAWREANPAKWAGLVGLGAGITGGLMAKLFHDVGQVV